MSRFRYFYGNFYWPIIDIPVFGAINFSIANPSFTFGDRAKYIVNYLFLCNNFLILLIYGVHKVLCYILVLCFARLVLFIQHIVFDGKFDDLLLNVFRQFRNISLRFFTQDSVIKSSSINSFLSAFRITMVSVAKFESNS